MKPMIEMTVVHTNASLLTGSNIVRFGEDNSGEATYDDPNLSRRHNSVWDEDEEDEEQYY